MVKVEQAESYLKNKIGDSSDIAKVWDEFKSFGKELVEGEDEIALNFQCGVYDFTGQEFFYFEFVRQFSIYDENEYSHMEQLHCQFIFEPTEVLRKLETAEWYFDYEGDVEDFYAKIENLEKFNLPMKEKPIRFSVFQEKV